MANVDLVLVSDSAASNIRIGNRYIDGAPRPGQSSTVAETSFWSAGGKMDVAEIYFDTDAYSGTNFYQIAVHEIGHALGLDHAGLASAVMYYMVNSQNRSGVLSSDDIAGIQHLYGAKAAVTAPAVPAAPATPVTPAISSLTTLKTAFANILRIDPSSSKATGSTIALTDGSSVVNPVVGQAQSLSALASQVDGGAISLAKAITTIGHYADATTSVATLSYQFFTGKTPTAAGLDYLVNSASNPNDLNDAYYAKFNLENRYINFASNLGKYGDGKAFFEAKYGALTLAETVKTAYAEIFGGVPTDQKVAEILNAPIPVGGQTITRAQYLETFGLDGSSGQGTKAAAVGFLLAEAVKADLGPYAAANDKFLTDLADGQASYNTDLKGAYPAASPTPTVTLLGGDTTPAFGRLESDPADLEMHRDGLIMIGVAEDGAGFDGFPA